MVLARKDDIVEDFHGTKVADPYRWLEDPTSEETKEWVKAIGEHRNSYFAKSETSDADKKRLEELWDYPKVSVPKKVKGRLFYSKNSGLQNQPVLYVKDGDEEVVLIDPNTLSEDGTVAMTSTSISHNAECIAYATSTHGSDWQEIHVRNVQTKKDEADHIQHVKFTNIAWAPDDSGFFYSRFPDPDTISKEDEGKHHTVYFHKLGTPQAEDELIYARPDHKELMFSPMISHDDQYLILHVSLGTASENRLYIKPLHSNGEMIRLLDEQDASYTYVTNEGSTFYFQTNLDAPNGKMIKIDVDQPAREHWEDVVPEKSDVLYSYLYINGRFVIAYLHDAHCQLHVYEQDGTYSHEIELPVIGSLAGMTRSKEDNDIYFGVTSYVNPTTIYRYNMDEKKLNLHYQTEIPVDTSQFETKQVFYPSKDGTKVPMFISHKKGIQLDGENPVILYGYGGFNISLTPAYSPTMIRWMEKGGIYAVANLRGGNEYGEEWHKAGMLEKKQNVFDDFIAAAEWLIDNKYTRKEKLAIMGGSNGGLLVAACMVQRPDLFGAVLCQVPVIDMLRYHKFTIGHYWIPEYGNAELPEHFPFLYTYSPLHNVKEGQKYPPILIATADSDDRVVPAHAKKFAATLLEKADKNSTVILRLEEKAGHGAGKPTSKVMNEWVDYFTFLDKELR
ncbi:prolyl oligopeptidase family serine peptidase [Bacillus niameyensis]|uniref:prolyl oligopeptidase family serine peptidase n=1 Tax=Bacillus niameyensis TaxID=1522308 RepID=UPI0007828C21|nr:prolyl oligopeptidase family serine peptidase [Bacillus niameyensis]